MQRLFNNLNLPLLERMFDPPKFVPNKFNLHSQNEVYLDTIEKSEYHISPHLPKLEVNHFPLRTVSFPSQPTSHYRRYEKTDDILHTNPTHFPSFKPEPVFLNKLLGIPNFRPKPDPSVVFENKLERRNEAEQRRAAVAENDNIPVALAQTPTSEPRNFEEFYSRMRNPAPAPTPSPAPASSSSSSTPAQEPSVPMDTTEEPPKASHPQPSSIHVDPPILPSSEEEPTPAPKKKSLKKMLKESYFEEQKKHLSLIV